jgi:hypothetical protein
MRERASARAAFRARPKNRCRSAPTARSRCGRTLRRAIARADRRRNASPEPDAARTRAAAPAPSSASISPAMSASSLISRDTRLPKPSASSARKNSRAAGRRATMLVTSAPASVRAPANEASVSSESAPTATARHAIARASSSVDFPQPFSPIRNVTALGNASVANDPIAGTLHGYAVPRCAPSRIRTPERNGPTFAELRAVIA